MKKLLSALFFVIAGSLFSQNTTEIQVSEQDWKSAKTIQELAKDLPSQCLIISYDFSINVKDNQRIGKVGGSNIPVNIKEMLTKGDESAIYIENITCKTTGKITNKYKITLKNE